MAELDRLHSGSSTCGVEVLTLRVASVPEGRGIYSDTLGWGMARLWCWEEGIRKGRASVIEVTMNLVL